MAEVELTVGAIMWRFWAEFNKSTKGFLSEVERSASWEKPGRLNRSVFNYTKANMVGRKINLVRFSRDRSESPAKVIGTEKRPTFNEVAIATCPRISPFPYVPNQIINTVPIRRETSNG